MVPFFIFRSPVSLTVFYFTKSVDIFFGFFGVKFRKNSVASGLGATRTCFCIALAWRVLSWSRGSNAECFPTDSAGGLRLSACEDCVTWNKKTGGVALLIWGSPPVVADCPGAHRWIPISPTRPLASVSWTLIFSIGLPFFARSCSAPLL